MSHVDSPRMMCQIVRISRFALIATALFLSAQVWADEIFLNQTPLGIYAGNYPSHNTQSGANEPMIVMITTTGTYYSLLDGSDLSNHKAHLITLAFSKPKLLAISLTGKTNSKGWKEVDLVSVR